MAAGTLTKTITVVVNGDTTEEANETFNVTHELVRRGYTEEEVAKIWSGNLLRVGQKL